MGKCLPNKVHYVYDLTLLGHFGPPFSCHNFFCVQPLVASVFVFLIHQLLGGNSIVTNPGQDCHWSNTEDPGEEKYPEHWPEGQVRKEVQEVYKNKSKGLQSFRGFGAVWPCAALNEGQPHGHPLIVHPEQVDYWYLRFTSDNPPTFEDLQKARGTHKCVAAREKYDFVLEHCTKAV